MSGVLFGTCAALSLGLLAACGGSTESTWYPEGYVRYDDNVAYEVSGGDALTYACGFSSGGCWEIRVISRTGCPNGLDAEFNIVDEGSTVRDHATTSLDSLRPSHVATLDVASYIDIGPEIDAELIKINCY